MKKIVEAIRKNGTCGCCANEDSVCLIDITITVAAVDLGVGYQFYSLAGHLLPSECITDDIISHIDTFLGKDRLNGSS